MPDLRQQRDTARTERDQLRARVRDLETILGDIAPEYANAYATICDLAIHGLRRPDDLGAPISSNHAESRAPAYHAKAYHIRNEERRWQRIRATRLRQIVEGIDGQPLHNSQYAPPRVVGRSVSTPLAQPSHNGSTPTKPYATLRMILPSCAPSAPNTET